ncbi:MAG: gamma-glutamyltransferase [Trueperaceae bacterium]|nr:gamma-glutamyltransferase [Trueperaceae bacterium]
MATVSAAVAAPHFQASQIGSEIFFAGGNAFDAAVAVSLAIGVTQPYHSGIGGGCNITFYTGDQGHHINARGPAPKNISPEMFYEEGQVNYNKVQSGPLAVTIPSLIAGLEQLHTGRGKLPWSDLCNRVAELARSKLKVDFMLANVYGNEETRAKIANFGKGSVFEHPLVEGETYRQENLAETLEVLGKGTRSLYQGELAQAMIATLDKLGGVLSLDDLAQYKAQVTELYSFAYRDWHILAPGLPTIGALQTQLALKILKAFPVRDLGHNSKDYLDLVANVIKTTYIKRAELGPTEISQVLSSDDVARELAKALESRQIGALLDADTGSESCTSHFCVADDEGNVVSQTQTIRSHFGSGVVDLATGIILNDSIGDFSLRAGETTTQGIHYKGNFNLLEGGKEPASSQSPLIALHKETGDVIAAGAAGGPKIVSATLQTLLNQIDFDLSAQLAVALPRIHNHGKHSYLESAGQTAKDLEMLGHELGPFGANGIAQTLRKHKDSWQAGSDPRGPGGSCLLIDKAKKVVRQYGYTNEQ